MPHMALGQAAAVLPLVEMEGRTMSAELAAMGLRLPFLVLAFLIVVVAEALLVMVMALVLVVWAAVEPALELLLTVPLELLILAAVEVAV